MSHPDGQWEWGLAPPRRESPLGVPIGRQDATRKTAGESNHGTHQRRDDPPTHTLPPRKPPPGGASPHWEAQGQRISHFLQSGRSTAPPNGDSRVRHTRPACPLVIGGPAARVPEAQGQRISYPPAPWQGARTTRLCRDLCAQPRRSVSGLFRRSVYCHLLCYHPESFSIFPEFISR